MRWEETAVGVAWLAVAVGAYVAARLTRPDRNYHPLLRVIWTALAIVGMAAGVRSFLHMPQTTINRFALSVVILGAILYSIYFMRRRNNTAKYLPLNIAGQIVFVDREHLRQQSETITSFVRHGTAPEEWVTGLEEACAEWRRMQRWRDATAAELRVRKAKRRTR